MGKDLLETSIKSFQTRMERCKQLAMADIKEGHFVAAQAQLMDAAGCQAVIEEYRFQLEAMEVNGND